MGGGNKFLRKEANNWVQERRKISKITNCSQFQRLSCIFQRFLRWTGRALFRILRPFVPRKTKSCRVALAVKVHPLCDQSHVSGTVWSLLDRLRLRANKKPILIIIIYLLDQYQVILESPQRSCRPGCKVERELSTLTFVDAAMLARTTF